LFQLHVMHSSMLLPLHKPTSFELDLCSPQTYLLQLQLSPPSDVRIGIERGDYAAPNVRGVHPG
jgi:hypothetical protein